MNYHDYNRASKQGIAMSDDSPPANFKGFIRWHKERGIGYADCFARACAAWLIDSTRDELIFDKEWDRCVVNGAK